MVRAFSGSLCLIVLLALFGVQPAQAQSWQLTDGSARDVGVGADGTVWVIGANATPGGYGIYKRTGNAWVNVPGGAERIAVDPRGNAWVANNANAIFRHDGTKWTMLTNQSARDIGVGANGTVWVIGTGAEAGGYGIHRSTDQGATWTKIAGGAVRISVDPQGNAWVVNSSNTIFRYNGSSWVHVPGSATDVGVGADGGAWVIGTDNGIYRFENNTWAKKTGGAKEIAGGPAGAVWVVNHGNQIYQANGGPVPGLAVAAAVAAPPATVTTPVSRPDPAPTPAPAPTTLTSTTIAIPPTQPAAGSVTIPPPVVNIPNPVQNITPPPVVVSIPNPVQNITPPASTTPVVIPNQVQFVAPPGTPANVTWVRTDGGARDVGVGANGAVWVIGANAVPGGYSIWKRANNTWVNVPGGAERIAVDPQGNAWVVNSSNTIFRHDGTNWVVVPGTARDIGIGANGTVWVIGVAAETGGYVIYRSTDKGANWTKIPGGAMRVSVDPQGNAWVVNNNNNIFRYNGSSWVSMPGTATDIGVGSDGTAWVIGADTFIYRWEASGWVNKTGGAAQIAAGPTGVTWVVQRGGEIYYAQAAPATPTLATTISLSGPTSINVTGTTPITGTPVAVPGSGGLVVGSAPVTGTNLGAPITVTGSIDTANIPGPVGASAATCGVSGKGLCPNVGAQLINNADVTCPSGSFPDLGRSACYSCPEGYTRSIHAVDNYKACQKPDSSIVGGYRAATFKAPLCATGSFFDPIRGGECYSCPSGYNRSAAHIDATNACYIPIHEEFSSATHHKRTIWPHECSSGTFWDGYNGGNCYSCPGGYRRTAYHINDSKACVRLVGETHSRSTLVKKAECAPGEIKDAYVKGTQNPSFGGGCWTCPIGTDRTIHPIYGDWGCEQARGIAWSTATRVRGMTCEPDEIYDPISSGNSNVADALRARNALNPSSPVTAKSIGGTCWKCPPGHKRIGTAVYSGEACSPPDIVWQSAKFNQPGLFGMQGAEDVALALVTERTVLNKIIAGMRQAAIDQGQTLAANYVQTIWDEIGRSPQDSAALKMAVFSRVVAAANNPAQATPAERTLLASVVAHLKTFRLFMANDALNAYYAWRDNQTYRKTFYLQSRLQVITDVGQVPPDFEEITAENIMGSLATTGAATTLVTLGMANPQIYKELFPFAKRTYFYAQRVREGMQAAKMTATALKGGAKIAAAMAKIASTIGSIALSAGPQIIVTIGTEVLYAAIEQQIDIANAEPKLLASKATAENNPVDFARLMSTEEGTSQAEGYWSQLMSGPAARDSTLPDPPAIGPRNLQAFAQQAAIAKQASIAAN